MASEISNQEPFKYPLGLDKNGPKKYNALERVFKMKKVQLGAEVFVRFEDGMTGSYEIVLPKEADILKRKVSINSPFGRAVLGQSEKAKIFFKTPSGQRIGCEILKIR